MIKWFQQAWLASNASDNPNNVGQNEEGGWIYLDIITGRLSVTRVSGHERFSCPPLAFPKEPFQNNFSKEHRLTILPLWQIRQ